MSRLLHRHWEHWVSHLSPHSCGSLAGAMLYNRRLAIAICSLHVTLHVCKGKVRLRNCWSFFLVLKPFKRRTERHRKSPQENPRQNPCKITLLIRACFVACGVQGIGWGEGEVIAAAAGKGGRGGVGRRARRGSEPGRGRGGRERVLWWSSQLLHQTGLCQRVSEQSSIHSLTKQSQESLRRNLKDNQESVLKRLLSDPCPKRRSAKSGLWVGS